MITSCGNSVPMFCFYSPLKQSDMPEQSGFQTTCVKTLSVVTLSLFKSAVEPFFHCGAVYSTAEVFVFTLC